MEGVEDKKDAELRSLEQISIEDIRYAKNVQWKIIYYSLLTFAALIAFYIWADSLCVFSHWWQKLMLVPVALFISFVAIYHLMDSQKSLCEYRMRIVAIRNGLGRNAVLGISIESDKPYRILSRIIFCVMLLGVCFFVCWCLYDEWPWLLILAIVLYSCALTTDRSFSLFKHKKYKAKKAEEKEYVRFARYFWDLIFPFMILIMVGVFFVAWLLLSKTFSLWQIAVLVFSAGFACFYPCLMYNRHIVRKARVKHVSIALDALVKLVRRSIYFLKEEEGLSPERRKSTMELCERLLSEFQEILKELSVRDLSL